MTLHNCNFEIVETRCTVSLLFTLAIILFPPLGAMNGVAQPKIIRGPYLQMPASSGIIIRWRSDTTTTSRVDYSLNPSLTPATTLTDTTLTTEHKIQLSGLSAFTRYYYAVGSITQLLSGPDSLHWFKTSPVIGTVQPVRIWAIGDFGNGSTNQKKVRDAFTNYNGSNHLDIWLWLGDDAYGDGTDAEYQSNVFDTTYSYGNIFKHYPFMPSPGNHDYNSVCLEPFCVISPYNHTGPYYDIIDVPTNGEIGGVASGLEAFYSYNYGNIHFLSLNSELGSVLADSCDWIGSMDSVNFFNSPLYTWLVNDLSANQQKWTIAYWHQIPYSKGSHDAGSFSEWFMTAMRKNILPILEQYGVDVVLGGHSHNYERSYLINGFYGAITSWDTDSMVVDINSGKDWMTPSQAYKKYTYGPEKNLGTVYMVGGNSGKTTDPPPTLDHPAMYYGHGCDSCAGSIVIDINGNRLDAKYLTAWGAIYDDFTIIKIDSLSSVSELTPVSADRNILRPCNRGTVLEFPGKQVNKSKTNPVLFDLFGRQVLLPVRTEPGWMVDCGKLSQGIYYFRQETAVEKIIVY
ncbi:MAG: metallophosphoesterase family protein [Bacteroidetes bacterium]|nr:metallophosphoesterase family protein [Bacteroidota bacterium]